jgi:hypothetical protein
MRMRLFIYIIKFIPTLSPIPFILEHEQIGFPWSESQSFPIEQNKPVALRYHIPTVNVVI